MPHRAIANIALLQNVSSKLLMNIKVTILSSKGASIFLPRAAISSGPFQQNKITFLAAEVQVPSFHGQPFLLAHFSKSRWPPIAAFLQVSSFHGQPFVLAHFRQSR
jgi:hypothetical protein